jgi:hypothetical protein
MVKQYNESQVYRGTKPLNEETKDTKIPMSEMRDHMKYSEPKEVGNNAFKSASHNVEVREVGDEVVPK